MSDLILENVNQHYLNRVVSLAETCPVEAGEDIYSASGIKLLSKGSRISAEAQERLILHKLKRPLEMSLEIACEMKRGGLQEVGERVIEQTPELRNLLGRGSLLSWIAQAPLRGPTQSMLAVLAGEKEHGLAHAVRVSLTALAIGQRLGLSDAEMEALTLAGLLHDIGELYLDPRFMDRKQAINLEAWRHVSVHPVIGHKLAQEVCRLRPSVARAILEHHERGDGSGYPKGSQRAEQSRLGSILGCAELVASLAETAPQSLARADLALRLGRGHFPQEVVSIINQSQGGELPVAPQMAESNPEVRELFQRLDAVQHTLTNYQKRPAEHPEVLRLLERVGERFYLIQRAFASSGLDQCDQPLAFASLVQDSTGLLHFEVEQVVREIRWRLRDLLRDLALRAGQLEQTPDEHFRELITALQGDDPHNHAFLLP